jgi:outer membrane murein-binding lipoprotein Lpp
LPPVQPAACASQQLEVEENLAEARGRQVQELSAQVAQLQLDIKTPHAKAQAELEQALSHKDH